MQFLEQPNRNLFFTGKGGVGKTSTACATAIVLADRDLRVLLVSTDPASNLDEVLQTRLTNQPKEVTGTKNLWAMNIDPEAAAEAFRERMVGPFRGVLPDAAVQSMEEQFSGSCTVEIAAFDEFARLLGDVSTTQEFDHVVFDTAPTGHTLRLLTLPSAWTGFMESNQSGTSCLGPLAGLQEQQKVYKQTVEALCDAHTTTLVLVARPEQAALREAARTSHELREIGVAQQQLVINGMFQAVDTSDRIATAMQQRFEAALADLPPELQSLPTTTIRLSTRALIGADSLRAMFCVKPGFEESSIDSTVESKTQLDSFTDTPSLSSLVDQIAAKGHGVVLTMGKGGVGKTTVAAAVAVALAERGHKVVLSTTDPAAHITATMASDQLAGLSVRRIDPAQEVADYRNEVMKTAGANLDEQGLALLEEDLRSPCTEEIAVFRAFAEAVAEGEDGFVVLDTAPTGHTILLLDAAMAYHREVTRQSSELPEFVQELLPRLRNPDFTSVLVVTLPESTPVHEAAELQGDLRRAGIEPTAWIVNQALSSLDSNDPILTLRQQAEAPFIQEVITQHSHQCVIVSWQIEPPVGLSGLHAILDNSVEHDLTA